MERRVEGEHAKIEHAAKGGAELPATVCARVRSGTTYKLVSDPSFVAWCEHMWYKHVFRLALDRVCTRESIKGWGRKECLRRLYLYGIEDQFARTSRVRDALALWDDARTRCLAPPKLHQEAPHRLALEWLRTRFVPGRLMAIEEDLYRTVASFHHVLAAPPAPCLIEDMMPILDDDDLTTSPVDDRSLVKFKVLKTNPGGRVLQHPWHLGSKPLVVRVVRYEIFDLFGTRTLRAVARCDNIDLWGLASTDFPRVLRSLCRYDRVAAVALLDVPNDTRRRLADSIVVPPQGGVARGGGSGAVVIRGSLADQAAKRVKSFVSFARRQFDRQAGGPHLDAPLPIGDDVDLLASLAEHGLVTARQDDGGAIQYAADPSSLIWRCGLNAEACRLEVALPAGVAPPMLSRIDLLARLRRQGFRPSAVVPPPLSSASELVYWASGLINSSKLYLCCLLDRASLFRKGAPWIRHRQNAPYYKALLLCEDGATVDDLAHNGDHRGIADLVEGKTLKGDDCADALMTIEDEPAGEEDDLVDVYAPVMWAATCETQRASVTASGASFSLAGYVPGHSPTVHFDGTHQSGVLRGWVRCPWPGHVRCFKYQHITVEGTRHRLIGYLLAWVRWCEGLERDNHTGVGNVPPRHMVDAANADVAADVHASLHS